MIQIKELQNNSNPKESENFTNVRIPFEDDSLNFSLSPDYVRKGEIMHSIFSPISDNKESTIRGESRLKEYENNVINTSGGINLKSFKSNKLKSNIFIQEIRSSREENEPRKFIDKSKLNALFANESRIQCEFNKASSPHNLTNTFLISNGKDSLYLNNDEMNWLLMELAINNNEINSGVVTDSWKNDWEDNPKGIEGTVSPIPKEDSFVELENEILRHMNL